MVARHVITKTLVALLTLHSWVNADTYEFKSQLSKDTWTKLQQLADISSDVDSVLQKYNGGNADKCRQQAKQELQYRADLDKKLNSYKSKLEYNDKLLQGDELKCGSDAACKEECVTKYQNNMDAIITNANVYIPPLKTAAVKNLTDLMDKCTRGTSNQQATTKSNEDEKDKSEPSDSYHW